MLTVYHCTLPTERCQDDQTERKCKYNSTFDTDFTNCEFTTLNCVNSYCTAVIYSLSRDCLFVNIGANVSQPIHCCLCYTRETGPFMGQVIWGCSIATSSLLPSGNYSVKQSQNKLHRLTFLNFIVHNAYWHILAVRTSHRLSYMFSSLPSD